jgi:hypothetical protein
MFLHELRFRPLLALLLALGGAGLLAACQGGTLSAADERRVFRYNQPEALTSLDPAFARNQANSWAVNQLYNGLLELNDSLQPAPALARRYSISPDGLTYTFWLRKGVLFHENHAVFPVPKKDSLLASKYTSTNHSGHPIEQEADTAILVFQHLASKYPAARRGRFGIEQPLKAVYEVGGGDIAGRNLPNISFLFYWVPRMVCTGILGSK